MKAQGVRLIAAAFVAAGIAGCFSDPTSSMRNGPARIILTRSAAVVPIGDSSLVEARIEDEAGNLLPITGATWASDDPAVADVHLGALQVPEDGSSRAYVVGVAVNGGVTTVRITARGLSDSVRVTALPTKSLGAGTMAISGTARADTVGGTVISAGDTLTITAPATLAFDPASSRIVLGADTAVVFASSAASLKAIALKGYIGRAIVTNVTFLGTTATGNYNVGALVTPDSITISKARFWGNVAVAASAFGPNTQMTATAPAGASFSTGAGGLTSSIELGAAPATMLNVAAGTLTAIATATYTGLVTVTNVIVGSATVNLTTNGPSTINAAFFPGTVVQGGAGNLLDTLKIIGGVSADFVTSGASASTVTINGQAAFILRRALDTLYAIAKLPGTSAVKVTSVIVSGTTIPALTTQGTTTVNTTTGEPNEPTNNAYATPTVIAFTGAADTITVYASVDCEDDGTACPGNGDFRDTYSVTTSATASLRAISDWFGNGAAGNPAYGSDPTNPDMDVLICAATSGACTYNATDLTNFSGAGLSQPETASTTAAQPAGTYIIRVFGYVTPSPITYKLRVIRF